MPSFTDNVMNHMVQGLIMTTWTSLTPKRFHTDTHYINTNTPKQNWPDNANNLIPNVQVTDLVLS
jgi:hypothetical protein